jgi:hypothetical protein
MAAAKVASGQAYRFEVLSGTAAETGDIYLLCADQDGDGAGTASASTGKDAEALLEQARDARK